MVLWSLMEALRDEVQQAVKDYWTDQPSGRHDISVYAGFPPVREQPDETESFIHCLVTKWTDSDSPDRYSTADVELGFSIYDDADVHQLANLMEHVRQHLLAHRIIAGRYSLQLPMTGEIATQQPYPQWQGRITATYTIGQPEFWG